MWLHCVAIPCMILRSNTAIIKLSIELHDDEDESEFGDPSDSDEDDDFDD